MFLNWLNKHFKKRYIDHLLSFVWHLFAFSITLWNKPSLLPFVVFPHLPYLCFLLTLPLVKYYLLTSTMLIWCSDFLFSPGFCLVLLTLRWYQIMQLRQAISSIFRQVLATTPINSASDFQVLVLKHELLCLLLKYFVIFGNLYV